MAHKAPGKSDRNGLTLTALFRLFPDDETAEAWFAEQRWQGVPYCPHCGSENVQCGAKHPNMTHRCRERECRKFFSLRTASVMANSKLGYQQWIIALYLLTTSLKGVSSMKLHRDLGITQKTAWHMAHRLREALMRDPPELFSGPVEVDETYVGGRRRNMHASQRRELTGRGPVAMTAVVGARDRASRRVAAQVVERTDGPTLQGFVHENAARGAEIYTDEAGAYLGLPNHGAVTHSAGQYVDGQIYTNGVESFWSMLKRAHKGTFHKMSPKHLQRYVNEFAGRHNIRELDTIAQMAFIARGMLGKRLRYQDLIA